MKRCLILIGNEGERNSNSFLPGVSQDINRYNAFFRSDFGGAWENSEIENRNFGWTAAGLRHTLCLRKLDRLDYALLVFAGHGYAERNGEVYFELSPGHEISLSDIKSLLSEQKMLMIADSCQGYLDAEFSKPLTESIRVFSEGGRIHDSRNTMRDRYNLHIERMHGREKAFASAVSLGECAKDTSIGGLYSRNLLDLAELAIESVPGSGIIPMNTIHSDVRERVSRITHYEQNPNLTLDMGENYPPFVVL